MVTNHEPAMDHVFLALSDPIRREILARLAVGDETVGELARPFPVSRPAISKHLDILERAGLVRRVPEGRTNRCVFQGAPFEAAMALMGRYRSHWESQLDRLQHHIESEEAER